MGKYWICICLAWGLGIDHDIYRILILFVDQFGIGGILDHIVVVMYGHGQYRVSQLFDQRTDDIIVRYTDADFFPVLIYFR